MDKIRDSFEKLLHYIESEGYKGYDPYDIHNSLFHLHKLPKKIQFILSQINKRTPINLRSFLGIKKMHYTKAMALFLSTYCNLYLLKKDDEIFRKMDFLVLWLKNNRNINFSSNCWGFDYDYTNRNGFMQVFREFGSPWPVLRVVAVV